MDSERVSNMLKNVESGLKTFSSDSMFYAMSVFLLIDLVH